MRYILTVLLLACHGCGEHDDSGSRAKPQQPGIPKDTYSVLNPEKPPNLAELNTHHEKFGASVAPWLVTKGPSEDPNDTTELPSYDRTTLTVIADEFDPIIMPLSSAVLIGFDNRNAECRTREDGTKTCPYSDTQLWFRSTDPAWPGVIFSLCRVISSPLLRGQHTNAACGIVPEWNDRRVGEAMQQADGITYYFQEPSYPPVHAQQFAEYCGGLLGMEVRRGEVIGYTGNVGGFPIATISFLVPDPQTTPRLNFVQPGVFFYWRCYSPDADFSRGVMAYPFECGGFQLSRRERAPSFKYPSLE